jgi:hypothetical protein
MGRSLSESERRFLMEPRRDESVSKSVNTPDATPEKKERKGRFQIVKLEERIAPKIGAGHTRAVPYCYEKNSK